MGGTDESFDAPFDAEDLVPHADVEGAAHGPTDHADQSEAVAHRHGGQPTPPRAEVAHDLEDDPAGGQRVAAVHDGVPRGEDALEVGDVVVGPPVEQTADLHDAGQQQGDEVRAPGCSAPVERPAAAAVAG